MTGINELSHLPIEIDLLFDNKKLDILKYLGILYQSKYNLRKRKINLEQLLYYYSMLYFESVNTNTPMIYKYLRDKKRINEIIIYLENLGFIQIHGNMFTRLNSLKISISDAGIEAIDSWQSDSIGVYLKQILIVMEKYPYGANNSKFQKLLYEGEF
ncbi:hypothetical protein PMT97_05975 [Enterococcus faecalis]|uniref:hypothetical protein n=1 Tax=Enterococcus faecalis TaxID=1351 RepID=UPI000DE9957F|nr:hypothetical protein [Enterococcus faecalis]EGO8274619.1 hypothetical protein [Enterococcus faecalis]MDB1623646.1 hypothetical protein [Enterococcus faecalis]RBR46065.1 hypothetical protein EB28_01587 [Enterococcus faecalis]